MGVLPGKATQRLCSSALSTTRQRPTSTFPSQSILLPPYYVTLSSAMSDYDFIFAQADYAGDVARNVAPIDDFSYPDDFSGPPAHDNLYYQHDDDLLFDRDGRDTKDDDELWASEDYQHDENTPAWSSVPSANEQAGGNVRSGSLSRRSGGLSRSASGVFGTNTTNLIATFHGALPDGSTSSTANSSGASIVEVHQPAPPAHDSAIVAPSLTALSPGSSPSSSSGSTSSSSSGTSEHTQPPMTPPAQVEDTTATSESSTSGTSSDASGRAAQSTADTGHVGSIAAIPDNRASAASQQASASQQTLAPSSALQARLRRPPLCRRPRHPLPSKRPCRRPLSRPRRRPTLSRRLCRQSLSRRLRRLAPSRRLSRRSAAARRARRLPLLSLSTTPASRRSVFVGSFLTRSRATPLSSRRNYPSAALSSGTTIHSFNCGSCPRRRCRARRASRAGSPAPTRPSLLLRRRPRAVPVLVVRHTRRGTRPTRRRIRPTPSGHRMKRSRPTTGGGCSRRALRVRRLPPRLRRLPPRLRRLPPRLRRLLVGVQRRTRVRRSLPRLRRLQRRSPEARQRLPRLQRGRARFCSHRARFCSHRARLRCPRPRRSRLRRR
ncbi:hypothetical protein BD626DRAFT_267499 [Schizophyllum amplum]|uniref:Uncharacterized protein n=1 Tax=Schizophyllum amplum TaxID=97359 RepID=A0A550BU67_9AGAR|nr:hypothetical protein BD626DRAFT_267499 [Auriculariopsis ampla]